MGAPYLRWVLLYLLIPPLPDCPAADLLRGGLDWILGKISLLKEL